MPRIAIIGSAGRKGLMARITREVYERMILSAQQAIEFILKDCASETPLTLLSGGAAVSDHVAVSLFLARSTLWPSRDVSLELFLPAPLCLRKDISGAPVLSYSETREGKTSNALHEAFSRATGINSRHQLALVKADGATMRSYRSFSARNKELAKNAEYVVAFGFDFDETFFVRPGEADERVPSGGTGETWASARDHATMLYVPITSGASVS